MCQTGFVILLLRDTSCVIEEFDGPPHCRWVDTKICSNPFVRKPQPLTLIHNLPTQVFGVGVWMLGRLDLQLALLTLAITAMGASQNFHWVHGLGTWGNKLWLITLARGRLSQSKRSKDGLQLTDYE